MVAVTNMKTTVKNTKRRKGSVLEQPNVPAGSDTEVATIASSGGWTLRLMHKFLRTPIVAVLVTTKDADRAAG